jgi:hypothetical protein
MPVVGKDCFECQVAFPVPLIRTDQPLRAHAHYDVRSSQESSSRIAVSIDDYVARGAIHKNIKLGQLDADSKSQWHARHPNSNRNENPLFGVMESCLQQIGIEQLQSDYIIQNVKMCIDQDAADKSTPMKDSSCRDACGHATSSQKINRNSKTGRCSKDRGRSMMMCNLPCRLSHADLIEAIDSAGFSSTYEFVHLPCRFGQSDSNLGYGFIHFPLQEDAERFALEFEGYRFSQKESTKAVSVKVADYQGRNAKSKRMRKSMRQAHHKSP